MKRIKSSTRDPRTTFIQGLTHLASTIHESDVLLNAYGEFVSQKISVTFSVKAAPIRKSGTGIKKEVDEYGVKLGTNAPRSVGIGIPLKQHRGKKMNVFPNVSFTLDHDPEFNIMLGKTPLFVVKKSKVKVKDGKDGGFGIFAAQEYKEGEVIGVYAGQDVTTKLVPRSEYSLQFGADDEPRTVQPDNKNYFFMGFHLSNDPYYDLHDKGEVPNEADEMYNIKVEKNLLVRAIRDMDEGKECFLFYGGRVTYSLQLSSDYPCYAWLSC